MLVLHLQNRRLSKKLSFLIADGVYSWLEIRLTPISQSEINTDYCHNWAYYWTEKYPILAPLIENMKELRPKKRNKNLVRNALFQGLFLLADSLPIIVLAYCFALDSYYLATTWHILWVFPDRPVPTLPGRQAIQSDCLITIPTPYHAWRGGRGMPIEGEGGSQVQKITQYCNT